MVFLKCRVLKKKQIIFGSKKVIKCMKFPGYLCIIMVQNSSFLIFFLCQFLDISAKPSCIRMKIVLMKIVMMKIALV